MTPILIILEPFNPLTGLRETVRIASAATPAAFAIDGQSWKAAIAQRPTLSIELMSPEIDGRVQAGRCSFTVNLNAFANAAMANWKWLGAPITLYSAPDLVLPTTPDFAGIVSSPSMDRETLLLSVQATVDTTFLEKPLLTAEFTGAGGLFGEADKRGTLKPAGFGDCLNIPPVWFDTATWIGMIDGYGNTLAVTKLMEGLDDRGASVGDYATYAALKAAIDTAVVAPGRWATCIAQGLVGLGAPPVKPIGVHATFGEDRLGGIMERVLENHAGVPLANIDSASFAALDVAVNYEAAYWTAEQRVVRDLLEAMAASANATPLVTGQGKVTITRAVASASVATLDRSGRIQPRVTNWESASPLAPVWRLAARVGRPASVIDLKDVLYVDDIVDRGAYQVGEVYRAGHVVWSPDKSSWLYIGALPAAGAVLPIWPTASNASWQNLTPPLDATAIGVEPGATRNAPGQLLKDVVFSPAYWTYLPPVVVFAFDKAPFGYALEIPFVEVGTNYISYEGVDGNVFAVEQGKRIFARLDASCLVGTTTTVSSAANPVYSGANRVIARAYPHPDWSLEILIDWFDQNALFISREVVGTLDPTTASRFYFLGSAVPPAGANRARLIVGHSDQAGKEGAWTIWSPWVSEHEPASDVTAQNTPTMNDVPNQVVKASALGVVLTGQLPRAVQMRREKGGIDTTATAVWTIATSKVSATIDSAVGSPTRGAFTITDLLGLAGTVTVISEQDGLRLEKIVHVTMDLAPPVAASPAPGATVGVAMATLNVNPEVTSTSYGAAVAATVISVTNGSINTTGVLGYSHYQADLAGAMAGKFQYSPQGANTWTDVDPEDVGSYAYSYSQPNERGRYQYNYDYETDADAYTEIEGSINLAQGVSGLANGHYDVRLLLRRFDGTATTLYAYGQVTIQSG